MKLKKTIEIVKQNLNDLEVVVLTNLLEKIKGFNNAYLLSMRFKEKVDDTLKDIIEDETHIKVSLGFKCRLIFVENNFDNKRISAILDVFKHTIKSNGISEDYAIDEEMVDLIKENYFYLLIVLMKVLEGDNYGK